jgi:hypothetical protein
VFEFGERSAIEGALNRDTASNGHPYRNLRREVENLPNFLLDSALFPDNMALSPR